MYSFSYLVINLEKTILWKDACTSKSIAALFTKAKIWKQPKCPLTEEWTKKIYDRILLSHKKLNNVICTKWTDIEFIILSEVSQTEKYKYHMISLICLEKKMATHSSILSWKSYGRKNLVGFSCLWGRKEWDMTEWLTFSLSLSPLICEI